MNVAGFYSLLDSVAPKRISDDLCAKYGTYDNSGILVNTGADITKVLFSLDLSSAAVENAIREKVDLIVTHHPAIYAKIGNIRADGFEPLGGKLVDCLRHNISVISMHLNLDGALDGIDECLMNGVREASITQTTGAGLRRTTNLPEKVDTMWTVEDGAYGRVYPVTETTIEDLSKGIEKVFGARHLAVYGNKEKIRRAASFCGAGADEETVRFAFEHGADVFISSDFKHHILALALEKGLAVIQLTHYASENYGFEKYYQKIRRLTDIPCVYHTDDQLL
jgi:dinuclear metal center YbgI/SA1388 family protein